jgi:hypothetical protein
LVRIIQGLIFVLAVIPFVGGLIGFALGIATWAVNSLTVNVFTIFVPRLIRLFDALPMRIVEQRRDNHATTVVGAGPVFLGLYSLAYLGAVDRLRILDDHPPAIVRVARVYSRLNRASEHPGKVLQPLSALNGAVAAATVVLFVVLSGGVSFVAADHLGWTNAQPEYPFAQTVASTSRYVSENANALVVAIGTSTRPVFTFLEDTIRPAVLLLSDTGDRLAEFSHGEATTVSRESKIVYRVFVALMGVVLILTVGLKLVDFALAIVFLPYRLVLKTRENTQKQTALDHLFYGAVEANSLIGVLSLLKHGANKNVITDEYKSPLRYALKKRRFRLAMHLAL